MSKSESPILTNLTINNTVDEKNDLELITTTDHLSDDKELSAINEFDASSFNVEQPVAQEEIVPIKRKVRKLRNEKERIKWKSNAEFIKDVLISDKMKDGETKPRKVTPFTPAIERKLDKIVEMIKKDLKGMKKISTKMC